MRLSLLALPILLGCSSCSAGPQIAQTAADLSPAGACILSHVVGDLGQAPDAVLGDVLSSCLGTTVAGVEAVLTTWEAAQPEAGAPTALALHIKAVHALVKSKVGG